MPLIAPDHDRQVPAEGPAENSAAPKPVRDRSNDSGCCMKHNDIGKRLAKEAFATLQAERDAARPRRLRGGTPTCGDAAQRPV
jgi:hypothetical protein